MFEKANTAKNVETNSRIFGRIPKQAMLDPKLSCEAKGLFGTFCAYTGIKNYSYPSLKTLMRTLNIGKKKLRNLLVELTIQGYITIGKCFYYEMDNNKQNIQEFNHAEKETPKNIDLKDLLAEFIETEEPKEESKEEPEAVDFDFSKF